MINIKFVENISKARSTAVLLCGDEERFLSFLPQVSPDIDIQDIVDVHQYQPELAKTLNILTSGPDISNILLFGLGDLDEMPAKTAFTAGHKLYKNLQEFAKEKATLYFPKDFPKDLMLEVLLGCLVGSYKFDKYKTPKEEDVQQCKEIEILASGGVHQLNLDLEQCYHLASSIELTKDLISEPSNVKNPSFMADACLELAKYGIDVQVLDENELKMLGMNALLGVSQGSVNPPKVVVMQWNGNKASKSLVALVGKGVTFDSGGLSLKPSSGMETMKGDMAGAATVIGAIRTLALKKAKVNMVGVIGLVENMPDGGAQRPGDIVKSMSGKTIEILNTDAEGRLLLSDVLWYTQLSYKPTVMIDFATLTGAMRICLGSKLAGFFSNDDDLSEKLYQAGLETGERLWRLPLDKEYDEMIDSKIADVKNIADGGAGSIVAAQFLQRFVNETPWAHIDIAAVSEGDGKGPLKIQGPTAFGLRLIVKLIEKHYS